MNEMQIVPYNMTEQTPPELVEQFVKPPEFSPLFGGESYRFYFINGYVASIIRHCFSYGGPEGFYEMAVMDNKGELCYDTPIAIDVIGWLTPENVIEKLGEIAALPPYKTK